MVNKVRGTGQRTDQTTTDRVGYHAQSERSLYRNWTRLNRSGSVAGESTEAALTTKEAYNVATEMDKLGANKLLHRGMEEGD